MLIIGIAGLQLSEQERTYLQHPSVAGVILFSRNFESKVQLQDLCADIRQSAAQPQLICVDQEGGRVQRFKDGFYGLPSLQSIGAISENGSADAMHLAQQHAYVMASEIIANGLDLSFAPVADLGRGNLAIGNRAFSAEPQTVAHFIEAYIHGMHQAGMAATLKHFPGHGSVLEDTHFNDANDPRTLAEISAIDLVPFRTGIHAGADAVMMAHVCYPNVVEQAAGFSEFWIQTVLKSDLGFKGVVFSDDIGMAAAETAGGVGARIKLHLNAGCDVVLACPPATVPLALDAMPICDYRIDRLDNMRARSPKKWHELLADNDYQQALISMNSMELA